MQELIALHEKILALPVEMRPPVGVNFSRQEDDGEHLEILPPELQTEVQDLRTALNAVLPEDFDYFAFAGDPEEEGPAFDLLCDQAPVGNAHAESFQPERSLVEQLGEQPWDDLRAKASGFRETLDSYMELSERMSQSLPSVKGLQREYREEVRDFVKEKRADASRIHVLYWDSEHGLMEAPFATAEELRDVLPGMVARGSEVATIVAWGKPLPVKSIDTLLTEAQRTLRERTLASFKEAGAASEAEEKPEQVEPPEAS